MNERIKELAKQCYETGPIGKDGWPKFCKLNEEKFAELIVRECILSIYRSDISDKKQERLVKELAYKFGFGVKE